MGAWFKEYKPGDPVRLVANVEETNRVHRILDDLQGIGCRIVKPRGANGKGWRIIVDGTSDLDPIPDSDVGKDTDQVPVKPYDLQNAIGVPRGAILIWAGQKSDIPPGWALCDGTNGTPDLRGRFVVGHKASDTYFGTVGTSGGSIRHTHPPLLQGHQFGIPFDTGVYGVQQTPSVVTLGASPVDAVRYSTFPPQTDTYTFSTDTAGDVAMPPFYVLAYIQKL